MKIKTLHDGNNFLFLNQVERRSKNKGFFVPTFLNLINLLKFIEKNSKFKNLKKVY